MEYISTSLLWDQGGTLWTTVALIMTVIALAVIERWWHMGKLERLGYTGPPKNFLYGNIKELNEVNTNLQDGWKDLIEKYGSRVGSSKYKSLALYQGRVPTIVVTDPEVVKDICIKNFDNFRNRAFSSFEQSKDLFALRDDRWKSVRNTLTPTFTQSKMKLMSKTMYDIISTTLDIIDDHVKEERPIDFYKLYHGLTLEIISKCALAINLDSQKNPDHPLLKPCKDFFDTLRRDSPSKLSAVLFPYLGMKFRMLVNAVLQKVENSREVLRTYLKNVIDARERMKGKRTVDALQLMMEAAQIVKSEDSEQSQSSNGSISNGQQPITREPKMSKEEVADNAIIFLLAGYETSSTMLSYMTYSLAKHQDVQQRLYEEIEHHMAGKDEVTYDVINEMVYLDMVCNESIRFYPPIISILTREVDKDWEYDGMKIPADCLIGFPIPYMHYDENLWTDPKTFDPERFRPDRKKDIHVAAFVPFGIGPRHCIGMRFALMEAKLALVRLLQKYHIHTCDLTEDEIKTKEGNISLTPQSGHIYLACTTRQ